MATTLNCGPGQTYTTAALAVAAIPSTPTGGYIIAITGQVTDSFLITGFTTSAANYITITAATGQSFQDNANKRTNALYWNASNGASISTNAFAESSVEVGVDYVTVSRLQIRRTSASYAKGALEVSAGLANVLVKDCIFERTYDVSSGSNPIVSIRDSKIVNCLVHDSAASTGIGIGLTSTGTALNCTSIRIGTSAGTGISCGYATNIVKNCAVFNWTTNFGGTTPTGTGTGYNGTNSASAPGSNNQTSLTFSNQFENTTNDFRLKTGANLINAGNTDSTNAPNDITGVARGATTAGDIGAWEIESIVSGVPKSTRFTMLGIG